jgi:hypothetical protein
MAKVAKSVADVVLGEAVYGTVEERFEDMLNIASVVHNRAVATGVTQQQVVANKNEFNAYNKSLPPGVTKYADLARRAIEQVSKYGPVNNATFYATPAAQHRLPDKLEQVAVSKGHNFFADPLNRAIGTAIGYRKPDPVALAMATQPKNIPTPTPRPDMPVTMDQVAQAAMAQALAPALAAQQQVASLPDVGPVPESRPSQQASPQGLAALSPSFSGPQMAFKSPAAQNAFSKMAPEMQKAYAGIERGLTNPESYTVTSTAEPRSKVAKTHVDERGAIDVRTKDRTQKQLDDLAISAMYEPGIRNISWDNKRFEPHAHLGYSVAYGKGLNRNSNISNLSPDVQEAMRSWDASVRAGAQPGTIANHGRIAPESIAPRDLTSRQQALAANAMDANASFPSRPGVPGSMPGAVTRSPLDAPAATGSFPGRPAPEVSGMPAATASRAQSASLGVAGATPEGFAELGAIGKTDRAPSVDNFAAANIDIDKPSLSAPAMSGPEANRVTSVSFSPNSPAPSKTNAAPSSPSRTDAAQAAANAQSQEALKGIVDRNDRFAASASFPGRPAPEISGMPAARPGTPSRAAAAVDAAAPSQDIEKAISQAMARAEALAPPTDLTTGVAPALSMDQMQQPPVPGLQRYTPKAAPAAAVPSVPEIAPTPQQASVQAQQIAAPAQTATGADVWGGRAQSGVATNGNALSRNEDGSVTMTSSKYGYQETMNPDGSFRSTTAPGFLGLDAMANSMFGNIGQNAAKSRNAQAGQTKGQAINPFSGQPIDQAQSRVGRAAQSLKSPETIGNALGTLGAAALGLGPVGASLGSKLGGFLGAKIGGPRAMSPREALMGVGKGAFPSRPGTPIGPVQARTRLQDLLGNLLGGAFPGRPGSAYSGGPSIDGGGINTGTAGGPSGDGRSHRGEATSEIGDSSGGFSVDGPGGLY